MQTLSWNNKEDIAYLVTSVMKNTLFVGTTDTVLGLMGAVNQEVRGSIDRAKIRADKPYVVLAASLSQVERIGIIDFKSLHTFLQHCWPGPVTIILKVRPELQEIIGSKGTVALRIPDHPGLQAVAGALPYGLYSTSANISGHPVPSFIDQVDQKIKDVCAYYIADEHIAGQPSTIIDCSDNNFHLVREGLYPVATLRQLYNAALH